MKIISIPAVLLAVSMAAAFSGCEQKSCSVNDIQPTESSSTEDLNTTTMSQEDAADSLSSMFSEASEWMDKNYDTYATDDGVFTFRINKAHGLTQYEAPDTKATEFVFTYTDTTEEDAVISADMGISHFTDTNHTLEEFVEFELQSLGLDDKAAAVIYIDSLGNHAAVIKNIDNSLAEKVIIVQGGEEDDFIFFLEMKNEEHQLSDEDIENIIRLVEYNKKEK